MRRVIGLCFLLALPATARAEEPDENPPEPPDALTSRIENVISQIDVHGFISQGYLKSTELNFLGYSKRGTFEHFESALTVTSELTDRLRAGLQLFIYDYGTQGNYQPTLDWAYFDYRLRDYFGVRAGKTKLPLGLYTDVWDVDIARVGIFLPQSVYDSTRRNFMLASSGVELYGRIEMGGAGALEYRLHGGALNIPNDGFIWDVKWSAAGRVLWELPLGDMRLRLAASGLVGAFSRTAQLDAFTVAQLVGAGAVGSDFNGNVTVSSNDFRAVYGSAELTWRDLVLAAEYRRWEYGLTSNAPNLARPENDIEEGYYAMATYRVLDQLALGGGYSNMLPPKNTLSSERATGNAALGRDFFASIRFDPLPMWAIKFEAHLRQGTVGLSGELNPDRNDPNIDRDWWILAAKTTVAF